MKIFFIAAAIATALLTSASSYAQAPSDAPAGSTGLCNDGSYFSGATRSGACSRHKGLKQWFGAAAAPSTANATAVPATPPKAEAPAVKPEKTAKPAAMAPAAGGGPDQVWVNANSKVYHCQKSRYYGKTKAGQYMTEAEAVAKGNRPDHGKACSK